MSDRESFENHDLMRDAGARIREFIRAKPSVVPLAPVLDVPEMLRKLADELDNEGVFTRAVVVLDAPDALDVRGYGPGLEPLQTIGLLHLGLKQLTDLLYNND